MNFGKPIDIEDAVQAYLNSMDIKACAPPVPSKLAAPMVVITRTGGSERAYVQDVHNISVDCYGSTWAAASLLADDVICHIRNLPYADELPAPCYTADILTMPYVNPDPSHSDLARVTFSASVATRSI